jgi:HAD superfamily hydrolase (TIGR01509 family)
MKLPNRPQAVIFDMDGVIFDTERMYQRALAKAVEAAGCQISNEMLLGTVGQSWDDCREMLRSAFGHAIPAEELIENWLHHYDTAVRAGLPLKAGVLELLDALDVASLPRAIATSAYRRDVQLNLDAHRIAHRFNAIVTHEDCTAKKPAPEPFLRAAARLNIDPASCLAIEDSTHGVQSAFAAGMMTVMVPDTVAAGEREIECCVHIAADLHEVREILAFR